MFARFDRMAKQFTRIGKEIAIAVKQSGPNPENNAKPYFNDLLRFIWCISVAEMRVPEAPKG